MGRGTCLRCFFIILVAIIHVLIIVEARPPESSPGLDDLAHLKVRAVFDANTGPDSDDTSAAYRLKLQYAMPKEILALLLLIGANTVQQACAAQNLVWTCTPVPFSFGRGAYAFNALQTVLADGAVMPKTNITSTLLTISSLSSKRIEAWVLGRLIRDLELAHPRSALGGIGFYFYRTDGPTGNPYQRNARVWFVFVVLLQCILAAVPLYDHQNWQILYVVVAGTALAAWSASLDRWKEEKFNRDAKLDATGSYALTRGNGHPHVFIIRVRDIDKGSVLNYERLAVLRKIRADAWTRAQIALLALLWLVLLIAIGGMEHDTWFLLLSAGIGMVFNLFVASTARHSSGLGFPLVPDEEKKHIGYRIDSDQVMESVLKEAEEELPGLGLGLLQSFFPTGPSHEAAWNYAKKECKRRWDKYEDDRASVERNLAGEVAAYIAPKVKSSWLRRRKRATILASEEKAGHVSTLAVVGPNTSLDSSATHVVKISPLGWDWPVKPTAANETSVLHQHASTATTQSNTQVSDERNTHQRKLSRDGSNPHPNQTTVLQPPVHVPISPGIEGMVEASAAAPTRRGSSQAASESAHKLSVSESPPNTAGRATPVLAELAGNEQVPPLPTLLHRGQHRKSSEFKGLSRQISEKRTERDSTGSTQVTNEKQIMNPRTTPSSPMRNKFADASAEQSTIPSQEAEVSASLVLADGITKADVSSFAVSPTSEPVRDAALTIPSVASEHGAVSPVSPQQTTLDTCSKIPTLAVDMVPTNIEKSAQTVYPQASTTPESAVSNKIAEALIIATATQGVADAESVEADPTKVASREKGHELRALPRTDKDKREEATSKNALNSGGEEPVPRAETKEPERLITLEDETVQLLKVESSRANTDNVRPKSIAGASAMTGETDSLDASQSSDRRDDIASPLGSHPVYDEVAK